MVRPIRVLRELPPALLLRVKVYIALGPRGSSLSLLVLILGPVAVAFIPGAVIAVLVSFCP